MAKQTKQERIIEALKARGSVEVTSNSRKYRQFTRPPYTGTFYFVGKMGALRVGRVASKSWSVEHTVPILLAGHTEAVIQG